MLPDDAGDLFHRYGPMVYRRALKLLGNAHDAEDACQEVFVRALRGAGGFRHGSQVATWLYRITTNFCLNRIRDTRRRADLLRENAAAGPPRGSTDADAMVVVRTILAVADEREAAAAIYVHVDGMSHDEAAGILGVSRRTVGNLVERFETRAREQIERTSTDEPGGPAANCPESGPAGQNDRGTGG